jgi:hypothetical protein
MKSFVQNSAGSLLYGGFLLGLHLNLKYGGDTFTFTFAGLHGDISQKIELLIFTSSGLQIQRRIKSSLQELDLC